MAKVFVAGMWHLGCVTAACLAKKHKVTGFDPDKTVVDGLKGGRMPIAEHGLLEAMAEAVAAGRLDFAYDCSRAANADVIYIAFDTPVDKDDKVDLSPIDSAFDMLMPVISDSQTIVISSQIPVGTSRKLLEKLHKHGKRPLLCYAPENLRLGSAMECFMNPERIVLGVSGDGIAPGLELLFEGVAGERMYMELESAEMVKHAMNSYLATLISFSGEISDLCEKTGANAGLVMEALRKERRVSPNAPIMPGLGFGGGTLARDVQILRGIGQGSGTPTLVLDAVLCANRERMDYVSHRLTYALGGLSGKTIAFFGLTYKPGTDTLRRSLALDVMDSMKSSGAVIRAYDPAVKKQVETHPQVRICQSAKEAAAGADAIVITTAWDEFRTLDYALLALSMKQRVIIDARNILAPGKLGEGIRYFGVGVTNG